MSEPFEARTLASRRYELRGLLATGGMGTIHCAFDTLTGRELAYKRLLVDREAARARMTALFRREYDTMKALAHPNTVEAYEFGFDAEGPYYTMELLSGSDLSRLAPLRWDVACRVLRDVASALALLHARRLLHRDVSPNNVRVTDEGVTKLLDYGGLTAFGKQSELVGTPQFLAPEVLDGHVLDQRSDLFSLGALLYWTLTQKVCFRVKSLDELPAAWAKPLRPPSHLVPDLPPELDELVLSLLQRDPTARPHSAAHVIERLSTIAGLAPEARERELAFDYLWQPRLLERQSQVDQLRGALEQVLSGSGGVVLIEARAGLGRSALLDRITRDAQLAGATVLRADGAGKSASLSLVLQLVKAGLQAYPDPSQAPREIELSPHGQGLPHPDGAARNAMEAVERRTQMASFMQRKLLDFSLRSPLLIVVDDAQSADPESIGVLAALADELPRHPVLLLLSLRTGEGGIDPLARAKLAQRGRVLTLEPLSTDGTIELVQTTLGDVPHARRLALFLHRESGGVPATVLDILRLLIQRGDVVYRRGTFTLPSDVSLPHGELNQANLLSRLEGLGTARRLMTILGVHGSALELSRLAQASGLSPRDVVLALEPAVARGVVGVAEGAYFLPSELLRKSLLADTSESALRDMHWSISTALDGIERPLLRDQLAAGYHRMCSGPEHELAGAELVATLGSQFAREGPTGEPVVPVFEMALEIFRRHGRSDERCLDLTVVLTAMGFWGDLAAQRRHLTPTLGALWRRCGLNVTVRLTPWLGGRLALYVGLLFAAVRHMFVRTKPSRSLKRDLTALFGCVSSAVAALASAFESRAATEVMGWLRPFTVLPPNTFGAVALDFSLATIDVSAMRMRAASDRYEQLLRRLDQGVTGIDAITCDQMRAGCIHGQAVAYAEQEDVRALALADRLEQMSPFFAPHAQTVRVGYHVGRGEFAEVARYRARAEALALLGGVSWSAFSLLTIWCTYAAVLTEDAVALTQALGALERLRDVSDPLRALHELALAHLEHLRGHHARANELYASILGSERGRQHVTYSIDVGVYADSLNEVGQYERARDLCEQTLAQMELSVPSSRLSKRFLVQSLARARAELGDHAGGYALLEACMDELAGSDNRFALGLLHRGLAYIAVLARDHERFDSHALAAEKLLRATNSPSLIAIHERLLTRAERAGFERRTLPREADLLTDALDDLGSTVLEDGAADDAHDRDLMVTTSVKSAG